MNSVKWVKITTDMFDNRKIKYIRKLPEGNNIVLIWVMLLTMAGRCNANGMIFLTENIPYTTKMLADELGFEENTVKLALEALKRMKMISVDETTFSVIGWEDYQNVDGMDKIREQNRLRQQKRRDRQKQLMIEEKSADVEVPAIEAVNPVGNKEKSVKYTVNFEEMWKIYPRKVDKGMAYKSYIARVRAGFSEEQLFEAAKNYAEHCRKEKTEWRYIKHASTFFGSSTPFTDYLKKKEGDTDGHSGRSNAEIEKGQENWLGQFPEEKQ